MDTKWKKSKAVIGVISLMLGVSLLITGIVYNPLFVMNDDCRAVADPDGSYEMTAEFRDRISNFLLNLIQIGAGKPVIAVWYEEGIVFQNYYEAESENEAVAMESPAESAAGVEETAGGTITQWNRYQNTAEWAGWSKDFTDNSEWTPEELKEMADSFHARHKEDKNLLYEVKKEGKTLYDNLDGQKIGGLQHTLPEGYDFLLLFDGKKTEIYRNGEAYDIYGDGVYTGKGGQWRVPGYENYCIPDDWDPCEVTIAVRSRPRLYMEAEQSWGYEFYMIDQRYQEKQRLFLLWEIGAVIAAVSLALAFLCRKERKLAEAKIGYWIGKIPLEIKLLFVIAGGLLCKNLAGYGNSAWVVVGLWGLLVLWLLLLDLHFGRCRKQGENGSARWDVCHLWKNSITARLKQLLYNPGDELNVQKKTEALFQTPILMLLAAVIFALIAWLMEILFMSKELAVTFLILAAIVLAAMVVSLFVKASRLKKLSYDLGLLDKQIRMVAKGESRDAFELPADSDLAEMSQKVSEIYDGLEEAVQERLKSERMKVELVANVSHDIKTPLTSIISYVDILREAEDLPEELRDYVKVLAQKSEHLRLIVQDVFEVSKAASGQLPVNCERLDLGKLLEQTLADMEDKIQAAPVQMRISLLPEEVMIVADGQRMYRVFVNLIENALKYSLKGSRVFITLQKKGDLAIAGVRNTSAKELDEELDFTERFVRGDRSRTDGGSGLGLSIAKSFTEACGGAFKIETMADLFVVTVTFPLA